MDELVQQHVSDVFINEWRRSYYHEPIVSQFYYYNKCDICEGHRVRISELKFRSNNRHKRIKMCDECVDLLKQKMVPYLDNMMTLKYNHFRDMIYYRSYEPGIAGNIMCINCNKPDHHCALVQLNSDRVESMCIACFIKIRSQSYSLIYMYSAIVLSDLILDVKQVCMINMMSLILIK